jgi:hypothetical protein
MAKRTVDLEICENPNCRKERMTFDDVPATGIYVEEVVEVNDDEKFRVKTGVYACSVRCVGSAIKARLKDAKGEN